MSQRHRSHEAEPPVQLQVQERHEEGEELPPDLLEHISEFTGYDLTLRAGTQHCNSIEENKNSCSSGLFKAKNTVLEL